MGGLSWQGQGILPDNLDVHDSVPDLGVPRAGQAVRPLLVIVQQPRPSHHDRCRACHWSRVKIKDPDQSIVTTFEYLQFGPFNLNS